MKYGFASHAASPRDAVAQAVAAEAHGLDSFWLTDVVTAAGAPDAITALAACAAMTQRITLATGVTDVIRRDVAQLAQGAATVDQLAQGRFVLALGAGYKPNLAPFHRPSSRLLDRIEETVPVLRAFQADEPVTAHGEFTSLDAAVVGVKPAGASIPIHLAVTTHRAIAVAGRLADGWYPMGQTPEAYASNVRRLHAAAQEAGRDPQRIERCLLTLLDCDDDGDRARERVLQRARMHLLYAPSTLRFHGVELPAGMKTAAHWMGEQGPFLAAMPDALALDVVVAGTPDECRAQLDRFAAAGVEHVVFSGSSFPDGGAEGFFDGSWKRLRV